MKTENRKRKNINRIDFFLISEKMFFLFSHVKGFIAKENKECRPITFKLYHFEVEQHGSYKCINLNVVGK